MAGSIPGPLGLVTVAAPAVDAALEGYLGPRTGAEAGGTGAVDWVERDALEARFGPEPVAALLAAGLLIERDADNTAVRAD